MVLAYPAWQNFSSLFREATTANEAKTGMERSHHLTASLYFGVAALEAFLNEKMRAHLSATKSEEEIFNLLRKGKVVSKLKQWPADMLGAPLNLPKASMDLIVFFNDVRADLTHPKTHGQDIYAKLEIVDPMSVINSVAEYIARFHEMEGTQFPYWLFGWNYLNPRSDSYEILLVNNQQFCFSLQGLGFDVPAAHGNEAWCDAYLRSFDGFLAVRNGLISLDRCEPKAGLFPFKPILCRRWWTDAHQRRCGHTS